MEAPPRLAAVIAMPRELLLRVGGVTHRARVVADDVVEVDGRPVAVEVWPVDESTFVVIADGKRRVVRVGTSGEKAWAQAAGEAFEIEPPAPARAGGERVDAGTAASAGGSASASGSADGADLSAPMPATVAAVLVAPGDRVTAGDPVVRLEAMKMELVVAAPRTGRVATVDCREGDLVQPGHPLITLEDDPVDGGPDAPPGSPRGSMAQTA